MTASRELDAQVAERVMGIPVTREQGGYWPPARPGENFSSQEIPEYSFDIAAAWTVVEKIKGPRRPDLAGFEDFMLVYAADTSRWWAGWGDSTHSIDGESAETAPLAICLAALKALESTP